MSFPELDYRNLYLSYRLGEIVRSRSEDLTHAVGHHLPVEMTNARRVHRLHLIVLLCAPVKRDSRIERDEHCPIRIRPDFALWDLLSFQANVVVKIDDRIIGCDEVD